MSLAPVLKASGVALAAVLVAGIGGRALYGCGARSREAEVADLSQRLAQSESTIRLKDGLYATKLVEASDLSSLIDKRDSEKRDLLDQLEKSKSRLLSTQQVVVKWRTPIGGPVDAAQTTAGPSESDPRAVRKRVDFHRDFGPIAVTGHTLTDPAEGEVSVRQTRPLVLTVNVARDPAGNWSSLVTSSEPSIDVGVTLGGVDVGILPRPSWYQRIWLDVSADALGDPAVSLGLSYRGDRFSIGASCFGSMDSRGCGLTGGIRLFK